MAAMVYGVPLAVEAVGALAMVKPRRFSQSRYSFENLRTGSYCG